MNKSIMDLARQQEDYIVGLRRYFHAYPELGGQEVNTQRKIMAELRAMGLTPRAAAGTGVVADLIGGLPGRVVALRADIDALPIQEENDVSYASTTPNVMHACGHDGHTAMLLGVARILTEMKDRLPGAVRFLFQPSEEAIPGGAGLMIEDGALAGADAVIGAHLWASLPAGTVGVSYGKLMAAPDEFVITVKGKGGHGSMPHQTVDSLLVGAQIVVALNTLVGRSVDPMEPAVLSMGMFKAGDVFNVIPDQAVLKGTVRSFEQAVRDTIFRKLEQIVKGVCDAAGAEYELNVGLGYPPVVNDPAIARIMAEAAAEIMGAAAIHEAKPVMGGEDFSCYLEKVPGAFLFIGSGNPDKGIVYPQHHPRFDLDEAVLAPGAAVMALTGLKLLAKS